MDGTIDKRKIEDIRLFFRFLKENKIFNSFLHNFRYDDDFRWHGEKDLKQFLILTNSDAFIDEAFLWSNTKEGEYFWENMDCLFYSTYLRAKKN